MTVSHWWRSGPLRRVSVDVVVVGAGVCGVSAALALERRGLRVAVLERDRPAAGASGRSAGFLMRGCADNYAVACRVYGRERARDLWRLTEENLRGLIAEGADALPSFRRIPSCLLAHEEEEAADLRKSVDLLREDGFDTAWVERGDDNAWRPARIAPPLGGLLNPHDASVNPAELVCALASTLRTPVVERAEVVSVRDEGGRAVVRTRDAAFDAAHALVCANAYVPLLMPELSETIRPTRGQMLALRGSRARLDMSYYANRGYEYFRQTVDGSIVVGGCRKRFTDSEIGYEDRTTPGVQGALESFARDRFGDEIEIVARWSGVMGFTPDGLPRVGPISAHGRVWLCAGFTGHGMSMAHRTAQLAVGAMLDGAPCMFHVEQGAAHAGARTGEAGGPGANGG